MSRAAPKCVGDMKIYHADRPKCIDCDHELVCVKSIERQEEEEQVKDELDDALDNLEGLINV